MNIWQALTSGNKAQSDNSTKPVDAAAVDVASSHEVIHNSSGDAYWNEFENGVKRLTPHELNLLNYRLGAGVPDNSDWRTYLEAFRMYQWFRFCEAYHYATGQSFTV